ncbi:MAG: SHOCT domain-containing protein [Propionibacteriaceae bacterium]|nr:SHOCT domain-containing protein [Propionibacteriaceae bacterium]
MLWGYIFIAYLMVLFQVIMDVFRDRTLKGWARMVWLIALFIAPPVTGLIYIIARGRGMDERRQQVAADSRAAAEEYVRSVAGKADPAESINKAKALLDSGAISAAEFDVLKAKALAL